MEQMETLDLLALVDIALNGNFDAISQTPNMQLEDLNRPLNVFLVHLVRPPVDVSHPAQLAGNTHTGPEPHSHAPRREPLKRIFHLPSLLADQVAARDGPTASFTGFAVHNSHSLPFGRLRLPLAIWII